MAIVKFVQLPQSRYDAMQQSDKSEYTIYFCSDTKRIYKGTVAFSHPLQVVNSLPTTGILLNTIYVLTGSGTMQYHNGTDWVTVGGSSNGVTDISVDNENGGINVTNGGTTILKRIKGLFKNISYSNGILNISTTAGEDSNSGAEENYTVNIPVEQFLSSVTRKVISASDLSGADSAIYTGCSSGDKGILFTMENGEKLFVKLQDLVDTYVPSNATTSAITVSISDYNISADLKFDASEFQKDANGNLQIKAVSIAKVSGLQSALDGKAAKTVPSASGNLASLTSDGSLSDSQKKAGTSTLNATPDVNTLATELAVTTALSWNIVE